MNKPLPNVIIANLHWRHTGVSSTIKDLFPFHQKGMDVGMVDWGDLKTLFFLLIRGYSKPNGVARYRVLHTRRATDMILGIFLRDVLQQKWKLVFTSAANHPHSRMFQWLLGKMDVLIATSSFTYNFLNKEKCSAEIHHGIDTTRYHPDPKLSEGKHAGEGTAIGCVGRVRHAKGVDLFVDAMVQVLPDHRQYQAIIAGLCKPRDEPYKEQLLAKVTTANLQQRIIFSGEVDTGHMAQLYRSMVLCIACSRSEGFGLTPFEALASGIPVVASKTGAWPILIDDDIGRVVEIDSSKKLIEATNEILANDSLRESMRKLARAKAVECFPITKEALEINKVYESLIY